MLISLRIFNNSNPIPIVLHTNRYMAKQGFWLVLNRINWINWLMVDEPMIYIILNHVDGVHMKNLTEHDLARRLSKLSPA